MHLLLQRLLPACLLAVLLAECLLAVLLLAELPAVCLPAVLLPVVLPAECLPAELLAELPVDSPAADFGPCPMWTIPVRCTPSGPLPRPCRIPFRGRSPMPPWMTTTPIPSVSKNHKVRRQ